MTQYLLSVWQPDGPPPPSVDLQRIGKEVAEVDAAMKEAGIWVFSGGLHLADVATVVRVADGGTLVTDGPYAEGKEHLGGFTIIEAADLDEAMGWAEKVARATTLPIEVRPFQDRSGE